RTQELGSAGANPIYYLDKDLAADNTTTAFTDTTDDVTLATQAQQDTATISGNYRYYVTFVKPGVPESHPSPLAGPQNVPNDRTAYNTLFQTGTLAFTGQKGGRSLAAKNLTITNTTTVQDLVDFITQSTGIQPSTADPAHPVPGDISGTPQGGSVLASGRLQI